MKIQYELVTDEETGDVLLPEDTASSKARLGASAQSIGFPWRLLVEILLVAVALFSLLKAYYAPPLARSSVLTPGGSPYVEQVPTVHTKFEASDYWLEPAMFYNETILIGKMERFVELSSDDRGVVIIDDWKEQHLPPPREVNVSAIGGPNEVKSTYTIAYWHHIHCIASVAKMYHNARSGVGDPEHDDEHMVHCLEVLRNAVMCLADTTPEDGVNWWENTHQCRDYGKLRDWAQEHAAWNFTEIMGARVDLL